MEKFEKEYDRLMFEMSMPRESDRSKMYYHGTDSLSKAMSIFKDGFKGQDITSDELLAPIKGKIYMTHSLSYAMIYAFGGIMMGHEPFETYEGADRYGVVFEIPGSMLGDIQPDEDSVGDMVYSALHWFKNGKFKLSETRLELDQVKRLKWLYDLSRKILTPYVRRKVMRYDDIVDIWDAGKKIVGYLSDEEKLMLIDLGAHVANEGDRIYPENGWLVDKMDSKKYNEDGSNFFELAKLIHKDYGR